MRRTENRHCPDCLRTVAFRINGLELTCPVCQRKLYRRN